MSYGRRDRYHGHVQPMEHIGSDAEYSYETVESDDTTFGDHCRNVLEAMLGCFDESGRGRSKRMDNNYEYMSDSEMVAHMPPYRPGQPPPYSTSPHPHMYPGNNLFAESRAFAVNESRKGNHRSKRDDHSRSRSPRRGSKKDKKKSSKKKTDKTKKDKTKKKAKEKTETDSEDNTEEEGAEEKRTRRKGKKAKDDGEDDDDDEKTTTQKEKKEKKSKDDDKVVVDDENTPKKEEAKEVGEDDEHEEVEKKTPRQKGKKMNNSDADTDDGEIEVKATKRKEMKGNHRDGEDSGKSAGGPKVSMPIDRPKSDQIRQETNQTRAGDEMVRRDHPQDTENYNVRDPAHLENSVENYHRQDNHLPQDDIENYHRQDNYHSQDSIDNYQRQDNYRSQDVSYKLDRYHSQGNSFSNRGRQSPVVHHKWEEGRQSPVVHHKWEDGNTELKPIDYNGHHKWEDGNTELKPMDYEGHGSLQPQEQQALNFLHRKLGMSKPNDEELVHRGSSHGPGSSLPRGYGHPPPTRTGLGEQMLQEQKPNYVSRSPSPSLSPRSENYMSHTLPPSEVQTGGQHLDEFSILTGPKIQPRSHISSQNSHSSHNISNHSERMIQNNSRMPSRSRSQHTTQMSRGSNHSHATGNNSRQESTKVMVFDHNSSSTMVDDTDLMEVRIPAGHIGLSLVSTPRGLLIDGKSRDSVATGLNRGDAIVALDGVDVSKFSPEIVANLLKTRENQPCRSIVYHPIAPNYGMI